MIDISESTPNPLDRVEQILSDNNWAYNRMTNDELTVQIAGKSCDYRLLFTWQEHMNALQFSCQYDLKISRKNFQSAALALLEINNALWMGHFELDRETMVPTFRHTSLLRGCGEGAGFESVHDLVDIALAQTERFRHVFDILSQDTLTNVESLSLALMETHGES